MSKKKSLGSSPIGFKSEKSSMGFIPDLGVSKKEKKSQESTKSVSRFSSKVESSVSKSDSESSKSEETKKKIVSYYLEIDLIENVKSIADQKDMYYSSLVSTALKKWLSVNS